MSELVFPKASTKDFIKSWGRCINLNIKMIYNPERDVLGIVVRNNSDEEWRIINEISVCNWRSKGEDIQTYLMKYLEGLGR